MQACLAYSELGARVYLDHLPAGLADELPALYNSLCCTQEWFVSQDCALAQGACVLEQPRHVLLFTVSEGTVEVLNKVFDISPAEAERACTALLRALPEAHRVHLEVMFPPDELGMPHRVLQHADHMFLDLPATVAEYRSSLSRNMRKSLTYHQNRLSRDFGSVHTDTVPAGELREELFTTFVDWKNSRFEAHGRSSFWRADPLYTDKFLRLLELGGEAHVTRIDGAPAAIKFMFPVGDTLFSAQSAFDPAFESHGLGLVSSYWSICDAIQRRMKRVGFMWGKEHYKERLGATARRATRLSVFAHQSARLHSAEEAKEVLVRTTRRDGQDLYWRLRHEAKRVLRPGLEQAAGNNGQPNGSHGNGSRPKKRTPVAFRYPDLRATVHPVVRPERYAAELESLYHSLFSTVDWFETHDHPEWMGACELEDPRHVLLFTGKGDTVEVLNKAFDIPATDARRAAHAFFRAFPHVRRIHMEVPWSPKDMPLPTRTRFSTVHMIADLPASGEEYFASLGKSMRKNLRNYENRLRRDFPDLTTTVLPSDERTPELFARFLEWKTARFRRNGRSTYWENGALSQEFLDLLRRRGEAHVTTIGGEEAAILFVFPVGDVLCAQESAYDPAFDHYRLGTVTQYWVAREAIRRGLRRMNALWGSEEHKARLGAVAHRYTALSIFRDQRSRLCSLDEAWEVAARDTRRRAQRDYWRGRHAARRVYEKAALTLRDERWTTA